MGILSLNCCVSPSNHLPLDSRCITGCATLGSPFREFPVFPFSISHPFLAPAAAICYLFSPVQRWLLHTPLPRPFPSLSFCPTALYLDRSGHHCFPNLSGRFQCAGRVEAEDHSSLSSSYFIFLHRT